MTVALKYHYIYIKQVRFLKLHLRIANTQREVLSQVLTMICRFFYVITFSSKRELGPPKSFM